MLSEQGVKEVTLLGQNVNSYTDFSQPLIITTRNPTDQDQDQDQDPFALHYAKGFKSVYKPKRSGASTFADLLDAVASVDPEMRIRFTSPHPKDFGDDVLEVIAARHNVCKQLHMPAQSGSSDVLLRMKRGYSREAYDALVRHVRSVLPGVALSTDMIAGFCGETEAEHAASVDLMKSTRYDMAFLFAYSERQPTYASKYLKDDVHEDIKNSRLQELIEAYRQGLAEGAVEELGRRHLVLVEGPSRRSPSNLTGRTDTFKRVVFPNTPVPASYSGLDERDTSEGPLVVLQPGDYVAVQVMEAGGGTLGVKPLARTSIGEFVGVHGSAVPLETYI